MNLNKILFLLAAVMFFSCTAEQNSPIAPDGLVPGQVTDITEVPLAGGAELHYKLPVDKNLLYVEAELTTIEGKTLNFKSSSYSTVIVITGLSSTAEVDVHLYCVGTGGAKSAAKTVKIHPLPPPFFEVFKSVKINAMFGGVRLEFLNNSGAELAFLLGYIDEDGVFTDYDGYYTKRAEDTTYIFRGLPPITRKYGIYIRDRWDNFSDTLYAELTPLLEEEIDKSKWKKLVLDNDGPFYPVGHMYYETNKIENLWDGAWSKSFSDPYMLQLPSAYMTFTFNTVNSPDPKSLTINLGETYRISRVRVNHYWQYTFSAARKWEVWGCSATPPQDGNWEWSGWVKLATMEQIKPSGLPGTQYGEGDAEAWEAGTNADVAAEDAIRYVRVRCLESWGTEPLMSCSEITLYGQKSGGN
ncbi:MAG: DUF5126 domain-containing protein [Dysgonamonadaceae bacterium]|jgi:hypothetical protein|nr:DUF5126 domain-containing protein [Dysgonamonadaceae bacterium]